MYGTNFGNQRMQEIRKKIEVDAVWAKGIPIPGYDPAEWRKDPFGAWMRRSQYGDCSALFGWEIDHIHPVSMLGPDTLANKQPLHWRNNRSKGDRPSTSGMLGMF